MIARPVIIHYIIMSLLGQMDFIIALGKENIHPAAINLKSSSATTSKSVPFTPHQPLSHKLKQIHRFSPQAIPMPSCCLREYAFFFYGLSLTP